MAPPESNISSRYAIASLYNVDCLLSIISDPNAVIAWPVFKLQIADRMARSLTHIPLDKMNANLADDIFNCKFMNERSYISIWISLKFVPRGPIDNRLALVQVMAWHRTGEKPIPEPTLTQFTKAYIRH